MTPQMEFSLMGFLLMKNYVWRGIVKYQWQKQCHGLIAKGIYTIDQEVGLLF